MTRSELLKKIETELATADKLTQPALRSELPLIVYGAGGCGQRVRRIAEEVGIEVYAFFDKELARTTVDGLRVLDPDSEEASLLAKHAFIVIAVFNPFHDPVQIEENLRSNGYSNIVRFPDFQRQFQKLWGNDYCLGNLQCYLEESEDILTVAECFKDSTSLQNFFSAISFRLHGDFTGVSNPDFLGQYLPSDVPINHNNFRFVDVGACDGDTLRALHERGVKFDEVTAFEPDPQNFSLLSKYLQQWVGPAFTWPCGLWHETTQLKFDGSGGPSGTISNSGEQIIQVVALDEVIHGFAPNFIKMDIEGSEPNALRGAADTIRSHRPTLAICCYHEPQHLWTILWLIKEWDLGYHFYLRYHGFNGFDWVLYAVPLNMKS